MRLLGLRQRPSLPERDGIALAGGVVEYRIRASTRRRTLGLALHPDGTLTVSAPHTLPLKVIREFVASQRGWIDTRRRRLAARRGAPMRFETGAALPLLGGELRLHIEPGGGRGRCRRDGERLHVRVPDAGAAHAAVEAWYRRQAQAHFRARVAHFAPHIGRAPNAIQVRAQRTRWGSCSARGVISLNWRLLQLPAALLDYVVVHELCHLRVPNHSPRFWAEVARVLPDWRERRRALRAAGRCLAQGVPPIAAGPPASGSFAGASGLLCSSI